MESASLPDLNLSENDLAKILTLLRECSPKWIEIGRYLGFRSEELDSIRSRPSLLSNAPVSYLKELLSQWLYRPTPYHPDPPTWESLREALMKANLGSLVEKVDKEMKILGMSLAGPQFLWLYIHCPDGGVLNTFRGSFSRWGAQGFPATEVYNSPPYKFQNVRRQQYKITGMCLISPLLKNNAAVSNEAPLVQNPLRC